MKNNKFAKITLVILTVALCLGTAFAISTLAADNDPTPVISSQNIMYSDKYSLMYAVPAQTVKNGAEGSVTIYVHKGTEPTAETYENGASYQGVFAAANTKGLDYDAFIFITDGIGAKEFATQYYVVAKDNTSGKFSALTRYSVAEYLYESLTFSDRDEWQRTMYRSSIDFATSVQVTVGEASERLDPEKDKDKLIKNLRYVVVEGGKIDGYNTGVYALGTTLTPVADTATELKWAVTTIADGKETVSNGNTSFTVIDAVKTVFTLGNKESAPSINYRDGYETFDNLTTEAAVGRGVGHLGNYIFDRRDDNSNIEIVAYEGRGNVVKINFSGRSDVRMYFNNRDVSGEDATAFEMSFDARFESVPETNNHEYKYINMCYSTSGNSNSKTAFYYQVEKKNDTLQLVNNNNSGEKKQYAMDTGKWMHIRMVIYKSEPDSTYFFINGGEFVYKQTGNASDANFFNQSYNWGWLRNDYTVSGTMYIDNYFCGYINDSETPPVVE